MNVPLIFVLITLIGAQPTFLEALENTVVVTGSAVNLKCQSNSGSCSGVTWRRISTTNSPASIFRDDVGIYADYRDRYSVDNSSGCNLRIKNVQVTDAGRFSCEDFDQNKNAMTRTAFLIVLESRPECRVNVSGDSVVEGDGIQLTCELKFSGTDKASMTWKDLENVPAAVQSGRDAMLSHSVVAKRPTIPSYECITTFELPKGIEGLSSNIPTAPPCTTDSIKLLYPVKTVTLTPSLSIYSPESLITCHSDGKPPPSYRWQITDAVVDGKSENWKDISGETEDEFSVRNASNNYYRCVASNTVRSSPYDAFSHPFQVNYTGNTVGIAAGVVAGVVGLLVIVVIVFLCLRVCKKERRGSSEKDKFRSDDKFLLNPPQNPNVNGSGNQQSIPVASVRPQPHGETIKRPTVPPPEPIPRKDVPKKTSPNPPQQREEVLYAHLEMEQEPRRVHQDKIEVSNSDYAAISVA